MTVWLAFFWKLKSLAESYCAHSFGSSEVNSLAWWYELIANVHNVQNLEPQIELGHFDAQSVDNKEHRKDHCTQ